MIAWLGALLFTQLVEVPIYLRALRDVDARRRWGVAVGASLVTHPVVWWVFPLLGVRYAWMVVLAETFAIAVEGLLLHRCGVRGAWLWSAGANITSATLGLTSRALFGWP